MAGFEAQAARRGHHDDLSPLYGCEATYPRKAAFLTSSHVLYFTCVSVGSALARLTPACGIEAIGDAMDAVLRL